MNAYLSAKIEARMPKKAEVKSVAYRQGVIAFQRGHKQETNPYPPGKGDRKSWFDGYFDARMEAMLARVRHNLGLSKE